MTAANNETKLKKKRIWHGIVTTLAAIVVFVTTYALIIPAITWEKTLICPLEEHAHSEGCYNSAGILTCGKEEHKHTDACFDAPKAAEKVFVCGKPNHIHTEDCYFSDGTLKCTLPEHQHMNACYNMSAGTIVSGRASDGAVAEINGLLPITARAEIEAVPLSDAELIMYFGAEKAALMTGYVAYDIKIMVGDAEWQPDASVSVTVKHPNIDLNGGDRLGLAHVEDGDESVKEVGVQKDENGDIAFNANGFSLYIIYKSFTVDFSYGEYAYSMNGMESIRLSDLFTRLCLDADIEEVCNVTFSDASLLRVEPTEDGDWLLTSLRAFQTNETLTVVFEDGSEIAIDTTDAVTSTSVTWDTTEKTATISVSGKNSSGSSRTIKLQYGSGSSYTDSGSSSTVNGGKDFSLSYTFPKTGKISTYQNWRIIGDKSRSTDPTSLGTIYDLMDLISVSSSVKANYKSEKFSDWLETDYVGNPSYLTPSAPTTMAELMTAFDYFFTGRVELPNVWCYHAGATEPYAKLYTLYDATSGNPALDDGDIIELHGDTTETRQSVIQKSIILRSAGVEKHTIDYTPTGGYLVYGQVYCDIDANGNATTSDGEYGKCFDTRDCITVCPDEFGTEIEVLFENVILDGFDAYHKENDIHDYHLLQTIHNVELTLSGVTIQNYKIQSNLNSNGVISLDGRQTYNSASGTYGNKIYFINNSKLKDCDSLRGNPYQTGGIMVNSAYIELTDTTIEDCDSRNGPAIVVDGNSTAYLRDGTTIQNCHGQEEGAAVRNSGTLYIEEGCVIQNCGPQNGYVTTLKGGAVYNKGTAYISGGTIKNCSANEGGAVYNNGTLYVSGGSMTGNAASNDPKDYDGVSATLGSGVYQDETMYLSGAPVYGADQDVYLPEGRVITKNGEITAEVKIPVVLEDEVRFRDILVSQNEDGKIVSDANLLKLNVKLSKSAIATTTDGKVKSLAAVYNDEGLDKPHQGAAPNVVELDISDILVVTKVWARDEEGTTHDPITVYLYKNGITTPVDQLILSEANGWKGIFSNIEVAADGSVPYHVSEDAVEDYITTVSDIKFIEGEKPEYWVPVSSNAFSKGEFVIYGNSAVLSHNGGTLTKSSPGRENGSITIDGKTYTGYYFEADKITDNMIWVTTDSSTTVKTKPVTGQTQYSLYYNSNNNGSIGLNTGSTSWNINSNKLRQGSNNRYLNMSANSFYTSQSGSATAIQLYQKVEGDPTPGHYAVTITNTKIEYTNLTVNKTWSDGSTNHDPVTIILYEKGTNRKVEEAVLSIGNGWTYTFENLLKPGENQPFGYYVIEDFVPGYVSMYGEISELVANQTYWVPAATNQFSAGTDYLLYSNGYVIERNGTSAIKATPVTRGMTVGGVSYPTYISGDEVSGIENTAVWRAERMGTSGSRIAIKNGNYYLKYHNSNGYQLSTSAGTVTMYNNSKLNLYSGSGEDRSNRYMNISTAGALSYTSRNSTASAFTLYVKRTITVDASGYEMTIENKEVITDPSAVIDTPDAHKTIDYLGDDGTNPDTDLVGEDFYRLYLDIDNLSLNDYPEGVDLLLILDGTSSMTTTAPTDGDYPVTHMDEIVNGSYGPGVTRRADGLTGNQNDTYTYAREADGLVYQFLNMNPNNRVGVVSFSSWNEKETVIRQTWATKAQLLGNKADDPKNYYINVTMAGSGTNYEAGYTRAQELLAVRSSTHPVIMVFMTDGRPNSYINDNNQHVEYKQNNEQREYDNQQGWMLAKELIADPVNNIIKTAVVAIGEAAAQDDDGVNAREMLVEHAREIKGPLLIGDAADTMRDAMFKAVGLVGYAPLKISDELSEYVTFADDLDLKITFEKIGAESKVIWNTGGATSDNVDDGNPIVTNVVINGDRIEVIFNSSMKLLPLKRITVSYNVTTTQRAQDVYSAGHTYPDTGDAGTDYPGNTTSSEQPGFYSNNQAQVVYRDAFEQYSEDYDHPVVQVPYEPVVPVPPPEIDYPDYGDDEVEIGKQIDYLGNDGIAGMDELYRLFLSLKAEAQPIDLLLVLDQSGSMANTLAGGKADDTGTDPSKYSRQKIMLDFLNGTEQADGSYNGFIARFLASNDENDLAILTFDRDSSLDETKRYIHKWGDKTDHITKTLTPNGATNYTAALWAANEIWELEAAKEEAEKTAAGENYIEPKKIMIFLSDGEPTFAYSDGKLQNGLTAGNVVGYGNTPDEQYVYIEDALANFISIINNDAAAGGDTNRRSWLTNYRPVEDDTGASYGERFDFITSIADERLKYPVFCRITGMDVSIPGLSQWPLGSIDKTIFNSWYKDVYRQRLVDDTAWREWAETGIKSVGDTYDIFWLSEWAYSEFAAANEDVITYTVGFSQETDGKYGEAPAEGEEDTRRERAEVLKYMSGEDRFFQCNTAEQLSEALNSVVLMSVTMTDKLSDYVEFASEENLEITIADEKYADYCEDGKDFAYIYTEGDFTELGELLLDTENTLVDKTTGTVTVVFKPGVSFNEQLKVEAAFTVKLTEKAYDDKDAGGYTATGDPLTDHDTVNPTSSGADGFFSNDNENAIATWTRGGEHEENFPKPVVQVPDPVDIRLNKINSETVVVTLSGAEFDLYREISSEKEGCITYRDQNGKTHYLLKINAESLVSDKDTPIALDDLRTGSYYLFETKAPIGYNRLARPVSFVVSAETILTADKNAVVDRDDSYLLSVINTSGGELPPTGGRGTKSIYTLGILLLAGAFMAGVVLQCKFVRKGRKE